MTHPHLPICPSWERLPGGLQTHLEGPFHSEAEGWAPKEEAWPPAYFTGAVLLGAKQPPTLAQGRMGGSLGFAALRAEFPFPGLAAGRVGFQPVC